MAIAEIVEVLIIVDFFDFCPDCDRFGRTQDRTRAEQNQLAIQADSLFIDEFEINLITIVKNCL